MTVVEYDGRIVVVDTGLMFPTAEMLGIDLVLPDFSYLRERADDIEAIVLTHGHEDHVGALPYVLREIGIAAAPIYGGPLTIGMVRSKLEEHKLRDAPLEVLRAGRARRSWARSSSRSSTWRTRSPTACAVALRTELGTDPDHRRLQVRPDPGRRQPRRRLPAGRARARGRALPVRRLDQRRSARHRAVGVERRARRCWSSFGALPGPDHRHLVRLQRPPGPAGDRRRGAARPQGRPRGPLDAQELQHRPNLGIAERAGGPAHPAQGDRVLPGRQGGRDLHRQPGRAAVGAAAHGARRPPATSSSTRATP